MVKKGLIIGIVIIIILVVGGVLLFGGKQKQEIASYSEEIAQLRNSSLVVSSQYLTDSQVTIDSLYLDKPGYVVIHGETDGKPGSVIGHSELISGEIINLKVKINVSQTGEKVFAMLHYDDNNDGVYGFPDEDKPVILAGNVLVQTVSIIKLAVQPEIPVKEFSIAIDENNVNPDTITVNNGEKVKITFTFNDNNIYYGGLDVYDPEKKYININYRKADSDIVIVEFIAEKSFTYTGYWPATGNKKASGKVEVVG